MMVHTSCQTSFNSKGILPADIAEARDKKTKNKPGRNSDTEEDFDYDKYCIFCKKGASQAFMMKYRSRQTNAKKIVITESNETKKTILDSFNEVSEKDLKDHIKEEIKSIKKRIQNVDFTKVKCRYHKSCYIHYVHRLPKDSKAGRRMKAEHANAAEYVIDYLSCNYEEECQFSILSILEECNGDFEDKSSIISISKAVKNYFQDEILVYPVNNQKDFIICFQKTSTILLSNEWYTTSKKENRAEERLDKITILDSNEDDQNVQEDIIGTPDFLWFMQRKKYPSTSCGWNGFMEQFHSTSKPSYSTSKIIPLPFVDNPPSDYDTIFTVLHEANKICVQKNQTNIFVTFDQPLYYKAREILACCEGTDKAPMVDKVIVRLGGFHLLMSFLGSIGHIMDGSGLLEAFEIMFAQCSAAKALTGHAYSRAVRGHLLVQNALSEPGLYAKKKGKICMQICTENLQNMHVNMHKKSSKYAKKSKKVSKYAKIY
ncbi:hypothetical protein TKK_0003038 [Trichogramma kaykai]